MNNVRDRKHVIMCEKFGLGRYEARKDESRMMIKFDGKT